MGSVLAICSCKSSACGHPGHSKALDCFSGTVIVTGCAVLSHVHKSGHQFDSLSLQLGWCPTKGQSISIVTLLRARTHQLKIRILYTNKAYEKSIFLKTGDCLTCIFKGRLNFIPHIPSAVNGNTFCIGDCSRNNTD